MVHRNEENKNTAENIILIDKPKGISSFDVIRILREKIRRQENGACRHS